MHHMTTTMNPAPLNRLGAAGSEGTSEIYDSSRRQPTASASERPRKQVKGALRRLRRFVSLFGRVNETPTRRALDGVDRASFHR